MQILKNHIKFPLIMISLFIINGSISAQYTEYYDIFFLNKQCGWIVGRTIIPPNPEQGLLLRTTDGDLNWENIRVAPPPNQIYLEFQKVFFLNEKIGWVLSPHGIFKSLDGGKNWYHQTDSLNCYNFYDIYFLNEKIGWLTGCYQATDMFTAIYKTVDGGDTWKVQVFENMYDPFYKITFIDSLDGYAVGGGLERSGSYVYHTADGGETWHGWIDYGYVPLHDAAYINRNNFWTVGSHVGFGTIIYTSDGENWVNQYISDINGFFPLFCIDFTDSLNGWAAGYEVVRTNDGGNHWQVVTDSIRLKAFAAIDTSEAWGLTGTASIVHSTDGGQSWQPVIITSADEIRSLTLSFQLFQNYPNPFNSFTTIKYQLSSTGEVNLKIYNLLGKEVRTLVNEFQTRGNYKIAWTGKNNGRSDVSSGIYLCQLNVNDNVTTKKLILAK
jgi:photosystem II stability/assembly factor-like uncharacterized protein